MHDDRSRAESFGLGAERYDRSRPTYPEALVDAVLGPRPEGLDVLDVGCGTGIAARLFQARGARVLGVEVDARMAEVARRRGTEVEVGRIEDWDPAGRSFDRVTAAQAWHWVDPAVGAQRAADVLRPDGRLCLFWNIGRPPPEVADALDQVYDRLAPGADSYSVALGYAVDKEYRDEKEGIRACPDLTDPDEERFPWSRRYSTEEWLDQLPTHSDHATMDPDRLALVLAAVAEVVDGFGGSFEMGYSTLLISARRR